MQNYQQNKIMDEREKLKAKISRLVETYRLTVVIQMN